MKNYSAHRGVASLVLVNAILLVLPVIDDLGSLFGSPNCGLFLLLASTFCLSEAGSNLGDQPNSLANSPAMDKWLARITGIVLLCIFWISLTDALKIKTVPSAHLLTIIGAILMVFGIILRRVAMTALGRSFRSVPSPVLGAVLITDGIFSRIRHPSELGLFSITTGACILLGSVIGLMLAIIVFLPLTILRVRREEVELRRHFGTAYDNYAANVGGLWPRLLKKSDGHCFRAE